MAQRILIVDDEAHSRQLSEQALLQSDYRVTSVECADARASLSDQRWDLLIVDLVTCGEDGLQLLDTLKDQRTEVPVLAIIDQGNEALHLEALRRGAALVIGKPFTIGRLVTVVTSALLQRGRILLVDDDPAIANSISMTLAAQKYQVTTANSGRSALERVAAFAPDVVLLDLQMPEMDGIEVCRALRARADTQLLPIVFLTAHDTREAKLQCIEAGGTDFLSKPFDMLELRTRLQALVQHKHLIDQMESTEGVLRVLARCLEANDEYTRGHSDRVAEYTASLAAALGLSLEDQNRLAGAGLLHDIGKVAVRSQVLHKPGALTEEERTEVECHPVVGVRILGELKLASRYLPSIRHHHERLDGTGYPDRLKGGAIPLDARMMAIADAFDAMTSHRPYRPALPEERALEILVEHAGRQWDDDLVQAFVKMRQQPAPVESAPMVPEPEAVAARSRVRDLMTRLGSRIRSSV